MGAEYCNLQGYFSGHFDLSETFFFRISDRQRPAQTLPGWLFLGPSVHQKITSNREHPFVIQPLYLPNLLADTQAQGSVCWCVAKITVCDACRVFMLKNHNVVLYNSGWLGLFKACQRASAMAYVPKLTQHIIFATSVTPREFGVLAVACVAIHNWLVYINGCNKACCNNFSQERPCLQAERSKQ